MVERGGALRQQRSAGCAGNGALAEALDDGRMEAASRLRGIGQRCGHAAAIYSHRKAARVRNICCRLGTFHLAGSYSTQGRTPYEARARSPAGRLYLRRVEVKQWCQPRLSPHSCEIYGKIRSDNWYGSGHVLGAVPRVKIGRPDLSRISTSHIERANLSVRMHLRRLTRLTNAFSKSLDNHKAAITLYVAFYNFCRGHQTLKGGSPAMAAGLADHVWTVGELLAF